MTPEYVPGPDDEYRGVVEIDCTEGLPEEVRAALRPTEFIREDDFCGTVEIDCSQPPAEPGPLSTPVTGPTCGNRPPPTGSLPGAAHE